ncbi:hypothetical protein JVX93_16505 [Mycolicibacterium boenickei]|nr:hypothetical protein JVX93_16505 [Mycolicibacterium boenickei]
MKRKLIEVASPLEAINREAVREKSVRHAYLPCLRDKTVLVRAIEDVTLDIARLQKGFALAEDYAAATGEFKGLTVPIEDAPAVVSDEKYLVASHVATAQRAREKAAAAQSTVAIGGVETTATSPGNGAVSAPASQPSTTPASVVERARYEGRFEVGVSAPDAIEETLREVIHAVVRHVVSAPGAENISIVLAVSAENSDGFSEAVARTVRENSKVPGFDESDFEGVAW